MNDSTWCCTASIDSSTTTISIQRTSGIQANTNDNHIPDYSVRHDKCPIHESTNVIRSQVNDAILDMTKAPDWMEYIEIIEHRNNHEGGAGAYDTMRGDIQCMTSSSSCQMYPDQIKCYIWGQEFHLQRIQKSFLSILDVSGTNTATSASNDTISSIDGQLQNATKESEIILQAMINEAKMSMISWNQNCIHQESDHNDEKFVYMIRLTLLWSPDITSNTNNNIIVRGHVCSTMQPMNMYGPITSIQCSIAAEVYHTSNIDETKIHIIPIIGTNTNIPSRYHNPQNKVASWTRLRKQLEEPERYKPPGISEVIMVRAIDNHTSHDHTNLVVLEGLSSNVFVIYNDHTIRTAVDGVLHGYVRQLVLDCVPMCGLTIDLDQSIYLHDVDQWKEVFITSSSRLIYPVSKIIIQHKLYTGETIFRDFWLDRSMNNNNNIASNEIPKWQEIYNAILHMGGY